MAFWPSIPLKKGIFNFLCREIGQPEGECLIKGNIDKATYEKFYHLPECKHYNQVVIEKDIGERYFAVSRRQLKLVL